jgi:hypothetical protein
MRGVGWKEVHKQLPKIGQPVIVKTDYGKCDICVLEIDDGKLSWVNHMRPQHTDGSVILWHKIPN